ncbi:MAG: hypothetical protein ABSG26_00950 [Bryobacteraceae bacterium]|jgi:hypothetical protein
MSARKRNSSSGKVPRNGGISEWSTERLEREIAKDLPPNPKLEHLCDLIFRHDDAPPLLLHYTVEKTAKNVIRTTSLWAFDAYELKDTQEVNYACGLLMEQIRGRHAYFLRRGEHLFADLCAVLEKTLASPRDCYPAVFVFCLTENIGAERHWQEYASNEGYALGFRFGTPWTLGLSVPTDKDTRLEADAVIRRVVYDPSLQRRMLDDVLDTFLGVFSISPWRAGATASDSLPAYLTKQFVENFKDFASRVVVSIKAPGYKHEREWRVIVAPRPGVLEDDFRRPMGWIRTRLLEGEERRYAVLVPHQGGLLPLCSMIAGPGCAADAKKSVGDALRRRGYSFPVTELPNRTAVL